MWEGILTGMGTLLIIVAVLVGAWWFTRKVAGSGQFGGRSRYMKMIDRMPLAQDKYLALVQLGKKIYIVGIAASEITLLGEMEEEPEPLEPPDLTVPGAVDFRELMNKIGRKKNGQ